MAGRRSLSGRACGSGAAAGSSCWAAFLFRERPLTAFLILLNMMVEGKLNIGICDIHMVTAAVQVTL